MTSNFFDAPHIGKQVLALLFTIWSFSAHATNNNCPKLNPEPDAIFIGSTGNLVIRNTLLGPRNIKTIAEHMTNHRINSVTFECVPGGLVSSVVNLGPLFERVDQVIVRGMCNSACAELALKAKSLILEEDDQLENPTMLLHGTTNLKSGQVSWHGLMSIDFLKNRLNSIPTETLAKALTDSRDGVYGLVISGGTDEYLQSKTTNAYLCAPHPENCTPIQNASLRELNIGFRAAR